METEEERRARQENDAIYVNKYSVDIQKYARPVMALTTRLFTKYSQLKLPVADSRR